MATVKLNERVNTLAVKYLMSMPKAWWKSVLSTDKNRKFEVEYKKVTDYLKGQLDGTGITRTYKFADGKNFGRQFDHSGLQGMRKRVRAAFGTSRWKEVWAMSCGCSALARLVRACVPQRPSRA